MKVLNLNIFFKLSDEFVGDLPDALIEAAEYLKSKKKVTFGRGIGDETTWTDFLNALEEGYRLNGDYGMNELVDNKWVKLD
jgi:hypothetical protein